MNFSNMNFSNMNFSNMNQQQPTQVNNNNVNVTVNVNIDENGIPHPSGPIKVVRAIYAQTYTRGGYKYDECVSAVQKCIRRCQLKEALHWAKEIWDLKERVFRSNLLNRLKIISSEDIGLANRTLMIDLVPQFVKIEKLRKKKKFQAAEMIMIGIVKVLVESPKSRLVDNIIHRCLFKIPEGKEHLYPPIMNAQSKETHKYTLGKNGDVKELKGYMRNLIEVMMKHKNELSSVWWAEKIWNIIEVNGKRSRENANGNKSSDPVYAIREWLLKTFPEHKEFINACWYFFEQFRNKSSGRLFLHLPLMYICRWGNGNDNGKVIKNYFEVKKELWEFVQAHEKIPMNDDFIDIHTSDGKNKKKRGVKHFFDVGAILVNKIMDDPYEKMARELAIERFKLGIRVPGRARVEWLKMQKKKDKGNKKKNVTGKKRKRKPKRNNLFKKKKMKYLI